MLDQDEHKPLYFQPKRKYINEGRVNKINKYKYIKQNSFILCASGACCPEDILRVPVEGVGVQIQEVLGWAPSCCGLSQARDLGSGPSCLLEMALGLGRVRAEVSLPLGGQGWTSLRGNWECVAAASTPMKEDGNNDQNVYLYKHLKKNSFHTAVVVQVRVQECQLFEDNSEDCKMEIMKTLHVLS